MSLPERPENIDNIDRAIWNARVYLQELKAKNANPDVIAAVEAVLKPIMAARETMEGISDAEIAIADRISRAV